jgi:hypothetical protein
VGIAFAVGGEGNRPGFGEESLLRLEVGVLLLELPCVDSCWWSECRRERLEPPAVRLLLPTPWLLAMPMVMDDRFGIRIRSRVAMVGFAPALPLCSVNRGPVLESDSLVSLLRMLQLSGCSRGCWSCSCCCGSCCSCCSCCSTRGCCLWRCPKRSSVVSTDGVAGEKVTKGPSCTPSTVKQQHWSRLLADSLARYDVHIYTDGQHT